MSLSGKIQHAAPGLTGFDVNQVLTQESARDFKDAAYDFCIRYLPRPGHGYDLRESEAEAILWAGLSLMAVQHVALPGWQPTAELGATNGSFAAEYAVNMVGLPEGINLWCDLEEVTGAATAQDVIGYCTSWFNAVKSAGFEPGLYVGWNVKLSAEQLYANLPFAHYWRAYNTDIVVATRGYQMTQHTQKTLKGIPFDPNTTQTDRMGDSVIWLAPA